MTNERKAVTKKARSVSPKRNWGKTTFSVLIMLGWVGFSVIASQIVVGFVLYPILGVERMSEPIWNGVYSFLSYGLALALILFVPKRKLKRDDFGLKGLPTWIDIGLPILGFIAYFLLAGVMMSFFSIFPWFNPEEAQDIGYSFYLSGFDRLIAFIEVVIVAPIAEEIIFRGFLYRRLKKILGEQISSQAAMFISIFLVSLLFGIVHLQWNVGVNVFVMSVVMCVLQEITGTIYSGIFLHMLKNGIAFYLLYVLGI